MNLKRSFLFYVLVLVFVHCPSAFGQVLPPKNAQEFEQMRKIRPRMVKPNGSNQQDLLGYYMQSNRYSTVVAANAQVINWPQEKSFAVFWAPANGKFDHIMVLLHGTGGTAYEEVADELSAAKKHGYALIGIQWLDKQRNEYADALTINRRMNMAIRFLQEKYQVKPKTIALCGFSRGSAVSYEVAYRDLQSDKHLKMVIAHSGGIPTDNVVAPGEGNRPGQFYADLTSGKLGNDVYQGLKFFLYAGCQDEQWGSTMCKYMQYTKEVLTRTGAKVIECIIDQQGKHMGYRKNPAYHDQAIQYFLSE